MAVTQVPVSTTIRVGAPAQPWPEAYVGSRCIVHPASCTLRKLNPTMVHQICQGSKGPSTASELHICHEARNVLWSSLFMAE